MLPVASITPLILDPLQMTVADFDHQSIGQLSLHLLMLEGGQEFTKVSAGLRVKDYIGPAKIGALSEPA